MTKTIEINAQTGEEILRDLTPNEQAAYDEIIATQMSINKTDAQNKAAKADLLSKLNISEDEAKLLLA